MMDSLRIYKNLEEDLHIISGKHLSKLAIQYNCTSKDILYPNNSQHHFAKRFYKYYQNNKEQVLNAFDSNRGEVKQIMVIQNQDRETQITENFNQTIIPLVQNGNKVYSNFGYNHVLQESINGMLYLAGRLKKENPEVKIFSILTQLGDCEVLKHRKFCREGTIKRYGKTIKLASICGAIKTDDWDGDTKNEKILGIDLLKSMTGLVELSVISIYKLPSEYSKELYFIDYEIGKNADNVQLDPNMSTIDYYQGLIYIEGSKANEPYELLKN